MVQNKIVFSVLMLLHFIFVAAQNGSINGSVTTTDGEPAEMVQVIVLGANRGATVNVVGNYNIPDIKPGTYTVRASFIGWQAQEKSVTVEAGKSVSLNFVLTANSKELKEVVVIANPGKYVTDYPSVSLRLKTSLLEVPQNIQVVTKQVIQDQQIFDMLEGITRNVSGATRVEHWDNYAQINMRGSQIAAFRNGMNVQSAWGPLTEDMSMVERIEFVKGPAGFMLANGEPSGFYNVVTKKPTGINKGEATMTIGSFDTYRSTLDFDGKLSNNGKVLYRLNVMGQMKGSHRDFEYNNRSSMASVLKFQFNPKTSLTAEYTFQFNQMSVIGSNYAFSSRKMGDLPINFTTAEPNMKPTNIYDNTFFLTLAHTINENWRFTGQIAYMHYNQEGQSIWPYSFSENGDTLFRGASVWDVIGITKVGQFFVNGDVKTGFINHRILAGIDMGDKDFYHDWSQGGAISGNVGFNVYNPVYGKVPGSSLPVYDRSLSLQERGVYYANSYLALYVQDELRFWEDKIRLTLAGRYTSARDDNPYSGLADANKFTPRIGFSYSVTKNTSVYAVFDEAFIPQAGADFFGQSFKPITGSNIEFGLKKEWLNGLWTASAALYQITKNNVLTADPEHQFFSVQLGQTQTKGLEFDLRGQIFNGLDLTVNYAYTNGKITIDTDSSQVGAQIPGTSKNIANAWLSYRIKKGLMDGIGIACGIQYAGDRTNWYGAYDNTSQKMPDYFRADGAISYQSGKFGMALNLNNIFGSYLYSGAYYSWSKFYYWQTEAGRNFRLTFHYKF